MTIELPDGPESSDEARRRLRGKRAGRPGEGFADTRIVSEPIEEAILSLGQRLARISKVRAKMLDYEDNPEQFLLRCPACGLMNDFTIEGQQIYYFISEFRGDRSPDESTTHHRIRILKVRDDGVIECQCGACDEPFLQRE